MKKHYLIGPYVFSLCIIAGILFVGVFGYLYYAAYAYSSWLPENELLIVASILFVSFYAALFLQGYDSFGSMYIEEDALVFRAPFKRTVRLPYEDIKFMGIDYGVLSLTRQFWIYFSREPIPAKYRHNIVRLKWNKNTMRIQYRKKVFDALVAQTPKDFSRRLSKCSSTLRLYHVDEEE